jgi:ATP-dependent DNA ligase
VQPPVRPMLAKAVKGIPPGMVYEPKFDGFRCIVFRDREEVELGSRNERPLTRYFPEVVDQVRDLLPPRCVLDGEVVVIGDGVLDFEALQQRIHPAKSRVDMLARETPASLILFDCLALGPTSYMEVPFLERRTALQSALSGVRPPVYVTPSTMDPAVAQEWFETFEGAGLDGVIAKPPDIPYVQDQRLMFKVKHERTADCVVAGFRWHKDGLGVGSLVLGLYQDDGRLRHIGVASSFSKVRRTELVEELAPYRIGPGDPHPWADEAWEGRPGGNVSRWNNGKDLSVEPLRPELVVEVGYDAMEGDRLRHVAHFKRWRPDRDPRSCTYDQLERPVDFDVAEVLTTGALPR